MMSKKRLFIGFGLLMAFLMVSSTFNNSIVFNTSNFGSTKPSIAHPDILIDGNAQLLSFQNKTGTGTESDPVIIENLEVDSGATGPDSCIKISNTNMHIIIRNCTLISGRGIGACAGIWLENVSNVLITNCTMDDNERGIYILSGSHDIIVDDCNSTLSLLDGIRVENSSNIIIRNSHFLDNGDDGIELSSSNSSEITNNSIMDNSQKGINSFNSHDILYSGNTLLNHPSNGFFVEGSNRSVIVNNSVINCDQSVRFEYVNSSFIAGNTFVSSNLVINLYIACCDNKIYGNNVSSTSNGIGLQTASNNNSVFLNYVDAQSIGIAYATDALDNLIFKNWVHNCTTAYIFLMGVGNSTSYPNNYFYNDTNWDTYDHDADGLTDQEEALLLTDPFLIDTDGDLLVDTFEVTHGSDPLDMDSDDDGLNDGDEVIIHSTDPTLQDTDGDGLSDPAEINTHQTDPTLSDSDYDGYPDGDEIQAGTNPLNSADNSGDEGGPSFPTIELLIAVISGVGSALVVALIMKTGGKKKETRA
ncbi:MAG: right-handed parallel beta-helix repeat-containing protein [Candidatus Hodarchaeota archaeon]